MGFLWANKQIKAKYTVAPELLRGLCVPGKTPEVEKCSLSPNCFNYIIGTLHFSAWIYSHCSRAALQLFCKSYLTQVWLLSIFIPSPTVWLNPPLHFVSSSSLSGFFFAHPAWPCNSAWTIWLGLLQPSLLCFSPRPPSWVCQGSGK